ncbi:MAG: molybdenum cofactor guanylyltransferase [Candidatus Neomarinimicrobiota bacterium]
MVNKNQINAHAFILIGGKSSRFGSPKWKTRIAGQTILDKLWNLCYDFSHKTIIGKQKEAEIDKPMIIDHFNFDAPINGLYTALKKTDSDWNLLLSCDLPLLTSSIIRKLWAALEPENNVIIPHTINGLEPTCAFYHRNLLKKCESMILEGEFSLQKLIDSAAYLEVDFGDQSKLFTNMNTVTDLELIKKISKS